MIERCRDAFPIRMMCRCLRVSSSGYYDWRTREPSARSIDNQRLVTRIEALHAASDGVMGSPRIWDDLRYEGETCSENRVARLMKLHGIRGIPQRHRWHSKTSGHRPDDVSNHLARDFSAHEPNTKWVTDITFARRSLGYTCAWWSTCTSGS
jgi:putative transposase